MIYFILGLTLLLLFWIIILTVLVFSIENRISALETIYIKSTEEMYVTPPVKSNDTIRQEIARGLLDGMQTLRDNDEKQLELLKLAREKQRMPSPVLGTKEGVESIDTKGDLIPTNLSKEEMEILRMYYGK